MAEVDFITIGGLIATFMTFIIGGIWTFVNMQKRDAVRTDRQARMQKDLDEIKSCLEKQTSNTKASDSEIIGEFKAMDKKLNDHMVQSAQALHELADIKQTVNDHETRLRKIETNNYQTTEKYK